jgi:hypothetical protein
MARKTRKSSARKKSARAGKKRGSARRGAGKRAGARRSAASKSRRSSAKKARSTPKRGGRQSTVARAKRVTREVVQQATDAVSAGVETLREVGGNLIDRVRTDLSS